MLIWSTPGSQVHNVYAYMSWPRVRGYSWSCNNDYSLNFGYKWAWFIQPHSLLKYRVIELRSKLINSRTETTSELWVLIIVMIIIKYNEWKYLASQNAYASLGLCADRRICQLLEGGPTICWECFLVFERNCRTLWSNQLLRKILNGQEIIQDNSVCKHSSIRLTWMFFKTP